MVMNSTSKILLTRQQTYPGSQQESGSRVGRVPDLGQERSAQEYPKLFVPLYFRSLPLFCATRRFGEALSFLRIAVAVSVFELVCECFCSHLDVVHGTHAGIGERIVEYRPVETDRDRVQEPVRHADATGAVCVSELLEPGDRGLWMPEIYLSSLAEQNNVAHPREYLHPGLVNACEHYLARLRDLEDVLHHSESTETVQPCIVSQSSSAVWWCFRPRKHLKSS